MSSAIDTTVDFRRKLLRFDRPIYSEYRKSNIPRVYSSFMPTWRSYFVGPSTCNSQPERYDVMSKVHPLRSIEVEGGVCYNKSTIVPKFNLKIIIIGLLFTMVFISRKKIFILLLIGLVYYFFPTIEFFNIRPVLQRGGFFYNPSWSR